LQPSTSIGQEKIFRNRKFLNQFDFDFLILTEAIDLDLQNFPYQYLCSPIPENTVYENLNYSEYLKRKKAFRTILYSKIPYSKKYAVTDEKTNLALEFETELGNIVFYCTIIGLGLTENLLLISNCRIPFTTAEKFMQRTKILLSLVILIHPSEKERNNFQLI
jgi:hypothetical protein